MQGAPFWMYERSLWLDRQFAATPRSVVFTHNKAHIWGDLILDDKADNVDEWADTHPDGIALLWDAPYNRTWTPKTQNAHRVDNWASVLSAIQNLVV